MFRIKAFWMTVILVYFLLSLPIMLGIGYVVDWVPEATAFQKFNGYVIGGLAEKSFVKLIVSFILGAIVYWIWTFFE